jgi:hypothetical protein
LEERDARLCFFFLLSLGVFFCGQNYWSGGVIIYVKDPLVECFFVDKNNWVGLGWAQTEVYMSKLLFFGNEKLGLFPNNV